MFRIVASIVGGALLAGCAATPSAPPAGHRFDGRYVGKTVLLRGLGFPCGVADLPKQITIRDGRFDYPFQGTMFSTIPVPVQVTADGRFHTSMQYWLAYPAFPGEARVPQMMSIHGRIAGDTLTATEEDARCTRRSVLHRQ